jgi:hypothetical protein
MEYLLSFSYKFPGCSRQSTYFLHWLSISWAPSMSFRETLHQVLPALVEYFLSFFYSSLATVHKAHFLSTLVEYFLSSFYKFPGYSTQKTYFLHWLSISWAPPISSLAAVDKVLTFYTGWVVLELPQWAPWQHYTKYSLHWLSISWASSIVPWLQYTKHLLSTLVEYFLSSIYKFPGYSAQSTYFLHLLSMFWASSISSLATVHKVLTFYTGWVFPELPLWAPWLQYTKYLLSTLVEYILSSFYKFPGYSRQSTYFLHWLSISWAPSLSSMATLHQVLRVLHALVEYLLSFFYKVPGYSTQSTYFLHWLSISWAPSMGPWLQYTKYLLSTLVEYFLSSLYWLPGETVEPAEDSVSARSHPIMFTVS